MSRGFCVALLVMGACFGALAEGAGDRPWTVGVLPAETGRAPSDRALGRLIETQLEAALGQHARFVVVERARLATMLGELALSRFGRRELQTGHLVGAELLITSMVSENKIGQRSMKITAVETVTGRTLLQRRLSPIDAAALGEPMEQFIEDLTGKLRRQANPIDVAMLPLLFKSPFAASDPFAVKLRDRLADRLAAIDAVRMLERDLGQFIVTEAALAGAGLSDPKHSVVPVAAVVTISGSVEHTIRNGQPYDASAVTVELTVSRGDHREQVRVQSTLAEAAQLETDLCEKIVQAVAHVAKTPVQAPADHKTDASDRRYWEAQSYLQQARAEIEELTDNADTEAIGLRAIGLATRAQALLPLSPEPFLVARAATEHMPFVARQRIAVMRRHFVDTHVEHPLWPSEAKVILWRLTWVPKGTEPDPEDIKVALKLARRVSDAIIDGTNRYASGYTLDVVTKLLVSHGEGERALNTVLVRSPKMSLLGWSPLSCFTCEAIDHGDLDLAYRAATYQLREFPGYPIRGLDADHIKRLRADKDAARWEPIIAKAESRQRYKHPALPSGATNILTSVKIKGVETIRAPLGLIMSVSTEGTGGNVWAVLRHGNDYHAWRVGDARTIRLKDLPELVSPTQTRGYEMEPSIAVFDGSLYVGVEKFGLFRVDLKTEATSKVTNGFPAGTVHALAVRRDALYAAGGGDKGRGFLARRRRGEKAWTVWLAPKNFRMVRRMSVLDDGRTLLYHAESGRVSRFDEATQRWDNAATLPEMSFIATHFAMLGDRCFFTRDYDNPLYRLEMRTGEGTLFHYPPTSVATRTQHEAFWSRDADMEPAAVAPLRAAPVDVVASANHLWVLDKSGHLAVTTDGVTFAGPFSVASSGRNLAVTADAIYVSTRRSIMRVSQAALLALAEAPHAYRTSNELLERTRKGLADWVDAAPPAARIRYFNRVNRPDLAAALMAKYGKEDMESLARRISTLNDVHQYEQAYSLCEPYLSKPEIVVASALQYPMMVTLVRLNRWDEILNFVPRLWALLPVERATQAWGLQWAYWPAVQAVLTPKQFEHTLWARLRGDLPQTGFDWNDNAVTRAGRAKLQWDARERLVRLLMSQRRFDEALDHPLLGSREWKDYVNAGRLNKALSMNERLDYTGRNILLELGRFDEVLTRPISRQGWSWVLDVKPMAVAALYSGRLDEAIDLCRQLEREKTAGGHRGPFIKLMRVDNAEATKRWAKAESHEFLSRHDQARQLYAAVIEKHAGSLAAAEASFRLAELAWLVDNDIAKAKKRFDEADLAFTHLSQNAEMASHAMYRRGQIALLHRHNPEAARAHWTASVQGGSAGHDAARFALLSLNDRPPLATINDHPPARIMRVDHDGPKWTIRFSSRTARSDRPIIDAPLGRRFELYYRREDMPAGSSWSLRLGRRMSHIRPGIALVRLEVQGERDAVWCLLTQ